jgi:hypothetical protein
VTGMACGSSNGTGDAAVVAPQVGTVVDEAQVVLGDQVQVVTLAPQQGRMELELPANATPTRTPVTVRAERGISVRQGLVPASDVVLHVATQGLRFGSPAVLRQSLPPAPAGRSYVAISSPSTGDAWATGSPAKLSQFIAMIDAAASDPTGSVWEIEVTGSGLWALALTQADVAQDAAPADAVVQSDAAAPSGVDTGLSAPVDAAVALDAPEVVLLDASFAPDSVTLGGPDGELVSTVDVGVLLQPDVALVEPPAGVDAGEPLAVDGSVTGIPADRNAVLGTWTIVTSICNGNPKTIGSGVTLTIDGDTGYFTSPIGNGACVQTVPTTNSYPAVGRMDWTTGDPTCAGSSCPTQACSPLGTIPHSAAVTISGSTLTVTEELTPPEEYGCASGYQVTTLTR